jgi:hypothetical protein
VWFASSVTTRLTSLDQIQIDTTGSFKAHSSEFYKGGKYNTGGMFWVSKLCVDLIVVSLQYFIRANGWHAPR